MRIAVPDLVSNSYFPAVAAIELGFFQAQGLDAELEMVFPVGRAMEALRDRRVDFVAGPAYATLSAFPCWHGASCWPPCPSTPSGCWWCVPTWGSSRGTLRRSRVCASEQPRDPTRPCAGCWPRRVWILRRTA